MKNKKLLTLLVLAVFAFASCGQNSGGQVNPPVDNAITLPTSSVTLQVGQATQITYTVQPAEATVSFNSSNTAVATVDTTGLVNAISEGTADITLTHSLDSTVTKTFTVTVEAAAQSVTHQAPFVKTVDENAVLRNYDEKFDLMVDDFSGSTLKGTLVGSENEGLLRVLVDSENGDFPNSGDASIYKTASAAFGAAHPDVVGFKMRAVGEGVLSINDLVLGVRGSDDFALYNINLGEALNSDNEENPELTAEWQEIEVDFGNTIEDDTTEYKLPDGSDSGVMVLDTMVGFHLFAKADVEVSQVIEIAEVYTVKGTTKTVVDCFDHPATNKNPTFNPWWVDSTGYVVRKGVNIGEGSYTVALPEGADEFSKLVVEMSGDNSALTVNGKAAKDPEGAAIAASANGAFFDFVIDLEASEITLGESLVLASEKTLDVSAIFLTNLQEKEAATAYPLIDIENRQIFDDFNRTQNEFIADWDVASTADYSPDQISVALSYHNGNKATVHDGVLDVQPDGDYVNVKEASPAAESGFKYLVIVAKGNLEGFRLGSSEVIWSHDWLAGPGLKSIPTDMDSYEYKTGEFVHYIIDLKENGSDIGKDAFIDMYFNNAVQIDSIYFANEAVNHVQYGPTELLASPAALTGYAYVGWVYIGGAERIDLTISGEGTLHTLRFTDDNGDYWFKNGTVINIKGQPISDELSFDAEHPLTISIDVAATGLKLDGAHLHAGDFDGTTTTGSLTSITFTRHCTSPWRAEENVPLGIASPKDYSYLGSFAQQEKLGKILEVSMVADAEGADLQTFRIEGGEVAYANQGKVILEDGTALDPNTVVSSDVENPTVIRIDLDATFAGLGVLSYDAGGYLHFHFGGWGESTAIITFSAKVFVPYTVAYELAQY